ncbi:MAG: hypothetical protein B6D56_02890 [Candidatus Omnitrophica bacterium 4484_70.1]|nr:MAG: hypothetical protein B6D56_02890 [Candidatus Omnitrophica bacterium 4484_70.1]
MRKKLILLSIVILFFGCYSLRKKFVRKKKRVSSPSVYVDFKEYKSPPSSQLYQDYYLFACGWLEELIKGLKFTQNTKKQRQAIEEAIFNMEQMMAFLNEEGRKKLSSLYKELLEIKKEIYSAFLNDPRRESLIKKTEKVLRKLSSQFSLSKASVWME